MNKKKIMALMMAGVMMFSVTACGGSDAPKEEPKDEPAAEEQAGTFDNLKGAPLTDAITEIDKAGYDATYLADGVDFTEFIEDVADDYTVGSLKVDDEAKTVEVTLSSKANEDAKNLEAKLEKKLPKDDAKLAVKRYGEAEYGDDVFKLNLLNGTISQTADDENTWSMKFNCKLDGNKKTLDAKVTATESGPEVTSFDIY